MYDFIVEWQRLFYNRVISAKDSIDNIIAGDTPTIELYDLYYQAVGDMKKDVYGNHVDKVEMLENGAIRFLKYEKPLNFEI